MLALLFSTAALAGYACPGRDNARQLAEMVDSGAPCAETMSRAMDDEQPGLCHAHCQSDQKSADSSQPTAFATLMQLGPVLTVPAISPPPAPADGVMVSQLRRETGPPLAVRHCCYRI